MIRVSARAISGEVPPGGAVRKALGPFESLSAWEIMQTGGSLLRNLALGTSSVQLKLRFRDKESASDAQKSI
jgi:hypothetical protein